MNDTKNELKKKDGERAEVSRSGPILYHASVSDNSGQLPTK